MLRVLLRHRLRLWRNEALRGPRRFRRLALLTFTLVSGLTVLALAYLGSRGFFSALAQIDSAVAESFLSLLFAGLILFVLFTGVAAILYQLYLASDLELLLAAPVPLRSLFMLKLIEGSVATGFGVLLLLAVLLGCGQALGMPPLFYPLALLLAAAVTLMTTALGMLGVMLAMRVVPAGRVEGIVALLGGLLVAVVWLLMQVVAVGGGRRGALWEPTPERVRDLGPLVARWADVSWWAPTSWATDALLAARDGRWPALALDLALLGAVSAGLVGLASLLFRHTFYVSWGRTREVAPRQASTRRRGRLLPCLVRPLPAPVRAIVSKDWRSLPRDLRWLGALIMPMAMVAFVLVLFNQPPPGVSREAAFWLGLLAVPLIPFMLGSGLSLRAFGYEGKGLGLLRAAPVSIGLIMAAKLAASFLPILAITWAVILALGVWHGGSLAQIVVALAMSAWLTGGAVASNVAGGALATDIEADNPMRSVGCLGLLIATATSLLFLFASVGLFAWLELSSLDALPPRLPSGAGEVVVLSLSALALVSVVAIIGLVWLAARNLESWEGQ